MKIGDIIRRKTASGTPIGPFMQIMHIERDRVYADVIGLDQPNELILRKNVYVPKTKTLYVSESKLEKLKKGTDIHVSHIPTKSWISAVKEKPELIHFIAKPKMYSGYFLILNIQEVVSLREQMIRITIDRLLL